MTDPNDSAAYQDIAYRVRTDPSRFSSRTGAEVEEGAIRVRYFGSLYRIDPESQAWDPPDLSDYERRLVLHYLAGGGSVELTDQHTTFQSLPNGMFYYGPFRRRSVDRLIPVFGEKPDLFRDSLRRVGAAETTDGDVGARFQVLPHIDVVVVLHAGDDEFPPEMKMLLPRHITGFLPLEDVAVLAGLVASRLIRSTRTE